MEQCAGGRDVLSAGGVGKEPIVADAVSDFSVVATLYHPLKNLRSFRLFLHFHVAARRANGRGEHHAALPYTEIGDFMARLRQLECVAACALEFAILTCTRTKETLGARWSEFNLAERLWVIPAERMKGGREHRVPLSRPALAVLEGMAAIRLSDFVFPGTKPNQRLGDMALLVVLKWTRSDLTVHGLRSTFSDWCAERTGFSSEVREMALAHAVSDKVEAAYRRGDLFEKRRQLAEAWARFCAAPVIDAEVVPLAARGGR